MGALVVMAVDLSFEGVESESSEATISMIHLFRSGEVSSSSKNALNSGIEAEVPTFSIP